RRAANLRQEVVRDDDRIGGEKDERLTSARRHEGADLERGFLAGERFRPHPQAGPREARLDLDRTGGRADGQAIGVHHRAPSTGMSLFASMTWLYQRPLSFTVRSCVPGLTPTSPKRGP